MLHTIQEFVAEWEGLSATTQKYLDALTDEALAQPVADGHRTLDRVARHLVQSIPEMMGKTGLEPERPAEDEPVPATAREIAEAYRTTSALLREQVRGRWTDASLEEEDDLDGSKWKQGFASPAASARPGRTGWRSAWSRPRSEAGEDEDVAPHDAPTEIDRRGNRQRGRARDVRRNAAIPSRSFGARGREGS